MQKIGITDQDAKIAGEAHEAGKGVVILINKWDEVEKQTGTLEKYKQEVYEKLKYLSYAPILFISAKTGQRINKLFGLIDYSTIFINFIWCIFIFILVSIFFNNFIMKIFFVILFCFPFLLISISGFNGESFLYVFYYMFSFIIKQKLFLYLKN